MYYFSLQATKAQYLISISIFSLAPALGTGIGTYLSERNNIDEEEIENDLSLQILQGKYIICRTQFWVWDIYHFSDNPCKIHTHLDHRVAGNVNDLTKL